MGYFVGDDFKGLLGHVLKGEFKSYLRENLDLCQVLLLI